MREGTRVRLPRQIEPDAEIGFLDDARWFNVALTRARRRAVVVSDADTVTAGDIFEDFIIYTQEHDSEIRSRWVSNDH